METKTCVKCGSELPLSEFRMDKDSRGRETTYRPRRSCKQCERERYAAWQLTERDTYLRSMRKHNLKRNFGITIEWYDEMLADQHGGCAICGGQNIAGKRLAVDHNYTTGVTRGLLCHHCNAAIGHVEENISRLLKIVAYIEEHKE